MKKFVALLRGINVGGHKKVPMKELKTLLEKEGFQSVKTLLASGNVIFESDEKKIGEVQSILEDHFGFSIHTIVLPFEVIEKIVASDPFKGIEVTPKTRFYITFSQGKLESDLKTPYVFDDESFQILKLTDHEIFSVLNLEQMGSVDAMKILQQAFGKKITTRSYNTVLKIAQL